MSDEPIYFDTETCGLHGPIVLVQWALGNGEIHLYEPWREDAIDTIHLFEMFANHLGGVIGFNLAFDWFHICQMYTTLCLLDPNKRPDILEYAKAEPEARDGLCLKPVKAFDIMLHARKGPYQSTMMREDIRIKKVPTALAWQLSKELEKRIQLKDIYFARRKTKNAPQWQVYDIHDKDTGELDVNFKDVVLKFAPSAALKALASDALGVDADEILKFTDVEVDPKLRPKEFGYAPFALSHAIVDGDEINWRDTWPVYIKFHYNHWAFNSLARKYATDDVDYTRRLYQFFGEPDMDDDDSVLACMVGAVRWKGYKVDIPGIRLLRKSAVVLSKSAPKAPAAVKRYIMEAMDKTEQLVIRATTKKVILEEIAKWESDDGKKHAAAQRAQEVLNARTAAKEVELYDKLLKAGRFHASFIVIGTLSSRMAGGDGLNAQGIKKEKKVRSKFPLAFDGYILSGGDFSGFEVVLADAVYNDPTLRAALISGKKIHGLFGVHLYPDMTYDEILATDGTADDKYTDAKRGVFALLYGGDENTLHTRIGIPVEVGLKAYNLFIKDYPEVGKARSKTFDKFCSMRQPGGIGTKVEWHEPADYIENIFGFRRYFTLENQVCKILFELANKPPKDWRHIKIKVTRRDREQTVQGATQSALYAAAFGVQGANMRAAANHEIQSSGGEITKMLQRRIWNLQLSGVSDWIVQPMNVHDEIMTPTQPKMIGKVEKIMFKLLDDLKPKVPLIAMEWHKKMESWADK